uniref:Uncharacterized protein n=1 Tax=Rousettus aegyptiacus TaxID=9407 RepID=A0A7J8F127_ROUAE|nr:hypothetical protein HJG63_012197 [Rousettus aegyptiacus]
MRRLGTTRKGCSGQEASQRRAPRLQAAQAGAGSQWCVRDPSWLGTLQASGRNVGSLGNRPRWKSLNTDIGKPFKSRCFCRCSHNWFTSSPAPSRGEGREADGPGELLTQWLCGCCPSQALSRTYAQVASLVPEGP